MVRLCNFSEYLNSSFEIFDSIEFSVSVNFDSIDELGIIVLQHGRFGPSMRDSDILQYIFEALAL